jgi:hypothetical protein
MAQVIAASPRRVSPIAALLVVIALAAALLLGFGLRVWTEHSPKPAVPALVSAHPTDVTTYQCRLGRAC